MLEEISEAESKNTKQQQIERPKSEVISPTVPVDDIQATELKGIIRAEINQMESFSGPLPRPDDFRSYEEVMPGAANRIFEMAEREAAHRHEVDNNKIMTERRDSLLGIIFSAGLCTATIVAGVIIALNVPSTAGTVMGGLLGASGLASVFGVMIRSTRTSWQIGYKESLPPPQSTDANNRENE